MGDIFRSAKMVHICLGPSGKYTDVAFAGIQTFQAGASVEILLDDKNHCFSGFLDIAERPWWKRVWVIQEAALARSATLHCGRHTIDFVRLTHVIEELVTTGNGIGVNLPLFKGECRNGHRENDCTSAGY